MTGQELIDEIRFISSTSATTFTDAEILSGLNMHYSQILAKITSYAGDFHTFGKVTKTDFKEVSVLSDTDSGYDGHYSFPSDLMRPTRVEVSYDGDEYVVADVYDLKDNSNPEATADEDGSESAPIVRFYNNYFVIRPTPEADVTEGIHVYYEHRGGDLAVGTEPDFNPIYHPVLIYMGLKRFGMKHPEKADPRWGTEIFKLESDMEKDYLNLFYRERKIDPVIDTYN